MPLERPRMPLERPLIVVKKHIAPKNLSIRTKPENLIGFWEPTSNLPLKETRPPKETRYVRVRDPKDNSRFVEKEVLYQPTYPTSVTKQDYQMFDAQFKRPTECKEAYKDNFASLPSPHPYIKSRKLFDHRYTKSPYSNPPVGYGGETNYQVNVGQAIEENRMPSVRTASQEHEYTAMKIEQDARLLHWKEWQLYSLQKLLHKYPGYVREHTDRVYLPHKDGDPLSIPFKQRKKFLHSLRYQNNDDAHHEVEMRTKLLALRVSHHNDGYSIKKFLNSS